MYAFGSNSSSQLAMGSTEKLPKATPMSHMANCQVVSVLPVSCSLIKLIATHVTFDESEVSKSIT